MNIVNKKLLIMLITIIVIGTGVVIWVWMFGGRPDRNQSISSVLPTASSTSPDGTNNILGVGMLTSAQGPVDLIVTDPDGFTITSTTTVPSDLEYLREIPGILYYSEMERGVDGNPIDRVYSYTAKTGDYTIRVIPASNAALTSIYTLDFSVGDQSIALAQNTLISQIPSQGYGVHVEPNGSISLLVLVPITSPAQTGKTEGKKAYINTEFGFEFQYPQNLIIKENTFGSYYSKFNLEIFTKIGEQFDSAFLVNIVLPEFIEHSFRGLEKTVSEITVAGVQGIKYQYKYQGFLHTAVILPFGELQIILATGDGSKQYLDEFNQILASFKFLK